MYSHKFKVFSLIMAVIMLTVSVGITAHVHYCFMEAVQSCSADTGEGCCENEDVKSCCELMNELSPGNVAVNDKNCCSDEIKSFSFTIEFVNKIVSVQLDQFANLLSYDLIYHFADESDQFAARVQNIFSPPKYYGTDLLNFKQVLNL